jgi:hypothetical protein
MEPSDLEKLRRFCLAIALILITYVLAGVRVDSSKTVSLLGLPRTIVRPELIPIRLIIASVYSTGRFWYYGLMLRSSPRKTRTRFLAAFQNEPNKRGTYRVVLTSAGQNDWIQEQFEKVLPQFPRRRAELRRIKVPQQGGEDRPGFVLEVPRRILLASYFEDLDYTSPIWLNVAALILAGCSLIRRLLFSA